jgi:hypothetical protein
MWKWAKKAKLTPDKLIPDQDEDGRNALYLAALSVWAEEAQVYANDLKKKVFTGQRPVWFHSLAPCSNRWQFRDFRDVMDLG